MRRSLALRRETLTDLTPAELTSVAGGSHLCGVTDVCTDPVTHGPSIDATCPTLPVADCIHIATPLSRAVCV